MEMQILLELTIIVHGLQQIQTQTLRVLVTTVTEKFQNLLTFTNYSGLDPEVSYYGSGGNNNTSSNTAQGFDFGNYPTVRTVTMSLNLKF